MQSPAEENINETEYADDGRQNCRTSEFNTTLKEKIMSVLIFAMAYIYFSALCGTQTEERILLGIFTVCFTAFGEIMFSGIKRSAESYIFLVLMLTDAFSFCFDIGNVWDGGAKVFFLHLFAVYWVLVRSGRLAENKTSHMFAWDGLDGFVLMPFGNFPLAARTIAGIFSGKKDKVKKSIVPVLLATAAGIFLLVCALACLKDSDDNFAAFMGVFDIELNTDLVWKISMSIPIGLYLYGLFGGCLRTEDEDIKERADGVMRFISRLKTVPGIVWIVFAALFTAFYIVFFLLQGSYLFDAVRMILPAGYTFSENAHRGFENMCAVMVINFALTWLLERTSENQGRALKAAGIVLMADSFVFALIAFLKLAIYIDAYGFTPLRLQSAWLVLVLFFACVCILVNMLTEKKTAGIWFIGSAVSLGILVLV